MKPKFSVGLLLRGIRRRAVDVLSLDRMSEKYLVLAVNYIFFMVYTTLESVFVNTLLYSITGTLTTVIYYRGIVYISSAIFMNAAAYLGQKKTPLVTIRTGAVLYLTMYIALFAALGHIERFMYLIAILSGAGNAFYWSGHNVVVSHYTTRFNRDVGIAILGIIQGGMTLLVPVVSGYVITLMPGTTGYRVMFGLGMAAVGVQVYVQSRMYSVEQEKHVSQIRLALKAVSKKASLKMMLGYEFIRGIREGTFSFIMNMMLFSIITNESLVGINTFLAGVASITGSWVFGRVAKPTLRAQIVLIVAAVLTGCGLVLGAAMNVFTVMLFSTISSFFSLFILNSCNNTSFDVLTQNETVRTCMGELLAFREVAQGSGRVVGLVALMLFPHDQKGYVQAILLLNVTQFVCGGVMWLAQRLLSRKARAEVTA